MQNRLFPNIELQQVTDSIIMNELKRYGIGIDDEVFFTKVNLLIGKNGAGKTRFLKAIRDIYSKEKGVDVVYAHFPSLSCELVSGTDNIPEASLYEWKRGDEGAVFDDTFVAIQTQILHFFNCSRNCISKKERQEINEIIKEINTFLQTFTTKEVVFKEDDFYVSGVSNGSALLDEALTEFSPGELMLLYMIIFLVLQDIRQKKTVIILDEPELHLHHEVLSNVFQKLLDMVKTHDSILQLWVATHNLFIVPMLEFKSISLVENSTIKKRDSNLYNNIISQMLGDASTISSFFAARGWWHYYEYIRECFLDPTVVDIINPDDRQVGVVRQYLIDNAPMNILDVGGGTGRLEYSLGFPNKFKDSQFTIFDKSIPKDIEKNGVKGLTDIEKTDEKYDFVVMMNFLHELEPDKWEEFLKNIWNIMQDDAKCLIVEETVLLIGEMPNESGYFIFNSDELRILFNCSSIVSDKSIDNRTTAVLVSRDDLPNVNYYTIKNAIIHLRNRALRSLSLYNRIKDARKYAFYLQQYINAKAFITKCKRSNKAMFIRQDSEIHINPEGEMALLEELQRQVSEMRFNKQKLRNARKNIVFIINSLKNRVSPSKSKCDSCWNTIIELEKDSTQKTTVAVFLLVLILAKHEKSVQRFNQNKYIRYLPIKIRNLAIN